MIKIVDFKYTFNFDIKVGSIIEPDRMTTSVIRADSLADAKKKSLGIIDKDCKIVGVKQYLNEAN